MVASLRSQSSLEILLASLGSSAAIAATGCAASFALIGLPLRLFPPLAAAKLRPHWAYFALFRPLGARFVLPSVRHSRLPSLAELAWDTPCLTGLTSRCFAHWARASCFPQFGIVRLPFARRARLGYSLPHWAYFALFRPLGARFVLPSVRHSRLPSLAELAWDTPCLAGLTSRCFAHWARASCFLQFGIVRLLLRSQSSLGDTPCLTGLTSRCFAHWARASCFPQFGIVVSLRSQSSLGILLASLGLLRAVSPTGRALRASLSSA